MELLEAHKTGLRDSNEKRRRGEFGETIASEHFKKGKEKCADPGGGGEGKALPNIILKNLKELKLNTNGPPTSKVVEHLAKGKSKTSADYKMFELSLAKSLIGDMGHSSGGGVNNSSGSPATNDKKKMKKQLKFLKSRLCESVESVDFDLELL